MAVKSPSVIWRDFETDGVPSSGKHNPIKADIREWSMLLQTQVSLVYATRAALYANLAPAAGTRGQVLGDPTPGYDGIYSKVGGTGTGSWTRIDDSAMQAEIDAIEADVAALDTRVDALETDIDALEIDVAVLDTRVDVLEPKVATNIADIDALETDVAALDTRVDDHAELLSEVFESVASLQVAGTPQTPVSGTVLSNLTYVFGTPVAANGFLTRVKGYALSGGGTLKIKRFTRAGDVFTHVATYPFAVPAGAFSLDFEDFVNNVPVVAGEYLGVYAWNGASILGQTVGGSPDTPVYSNSAVGGETTTTFTDASLGTGTRLELSITVGNADALRAEVTALDTRVDDHAELLSEVFESVASLQVAGTPQTPVSGTVLSNLTYVFGTPVAANGFLTRVKGYALSGGGTLKIKRFTRAGDVFTHVATYPFAVPAGAFSLDFEDFVNNVPVVAGEYLGVYAWNGASILGTTVGGTPDTPVYSNSAVGGETTTTFTDASLGTGTRLELSITVGNATVSEARLAATEDQLALVMEALRNIGSEAYSPAIAFLDYGGAWYDFSDKSTLFVDTAGTTPVTADGNLIGYVRDKSGNGYHYKAASDAVRGTYRAGVVGSKGIGRFASGKYLTAVKHGITRNIGKITIFAVAKFTSASGDQAIIEHMAIGSTTTLQILLGNLSHPLGSRMAMGARQTTAGPAGTPASYRWAPVTDFVLQEGVVNFAGGTLNFFDNGRNVVEGAKLFPASQNSEDFDEGGSYIAGNPAASDSFAGDICEIVEVVGDIDDVTRAGIYSYLASRWGDIALGDLEFYDPAGPLPGIWLWFNDPRAIFYSANVFLVGAVSGGGSVMAAKYDYTAGTLAIEHTMLFERLQVDDHVNPAFVKLADNHTLAFYTRHGSGTGQFYMSKTTTAGSLAAWNAPVDIGLQMEPAVRYDRFSYANVIRLPSESNRLYLVCRAEDLDVDDEFWMYSTSDDNGATWTLGKILWDNKDRPYTKICQNGNGRIDFAFNDGHPGEKPANSLYHCHMTGGNFYRTDGTLIANSSALPLAMAAVTKVYDAAVGALGRSWVWDVSFDPANNRPVICFVVFPSPAYSDHRYRQARWNGTAWTHNEVCSGGGQLIANQPSYSGGVITDPQNPNIVYASREISGVFQLFKYVSADAGVTWTGTQLTTGTVDCFRQFIPIGSRKLFYCRGDYGPDYSDIDTEIVAMDIV